MYDFASEQGFSGFEEKELEDISHYESGGLSLRITWANSQIPFLNSC